MRPYRVAASVAAVTALCLSTLAPPVGAAQPSAAPRSRRSPTSRSTATPTTAPVSSPVPGPVAEPVKVWSRTVDGSIDFTPELADGMLLVGTTEGHFFALDARTGDGAMALRDGRLDGPFRLGRRRHGRVLHRRHPARARTGHRHGALEPTRRGHGLGHRRRRRLLPGLGRPRLRGRPCDRQAGLGLGQPGHRDRHQRRRRHRVRLGRQRPPLRHLDRRRHGNVAPPVERLDPRHPDHRHRPDLRHRRQRRRRARRRVLRAGPRLGQDAVDLPDPEPRRDAARRPRRRRLLPRDHRRRPVRLPDREPTPRAPRPSRSGTPRSTAARGATRRSWTTPST